MQKYNYTMKAFRSKCYKNILPLYSCKAQWGMAKAWETPLNLSIQLANTSA